MVGLRWVTLVACVGVCLSGALWGPKGAAASQQPAQGAALQEATPKALKEATKSYVRGTVLFQKKDFGKAMAEFERSYQTVRSPNALLMVARCLAELGQLSEAYRRFEQTEREATEAQAMADKYRATATAARDERLRLRERLGMLTIEVPEGGPNDKITLEGRQYILDELGEPIPVMPGEVPVIWAHDLGVTEKKVRVEVGKQERLVLQAAKPAEPLKTQSVPDQAPAPEAKAGSNPPWLLYASGGVFVLGAATFVAYGSKANSKYDELERLCAADRACPPGGASIRDEGRRAQVVANTGLLVGLFGATAAALLHFGGERETSSGKQVSAKLQIGVDFVTLSGSF